ncbi:helix-turn-helix transcriptional regulator [Peptacetobacter sp. AB800]|uniref:helix-turn-helix transcriptional regulator n=1 Tax=Peptacetobacter sp. AB800 TaxID=3388428 RepID=UPI0039FBDBEE
MNNILRDYRKQLNKTQIEMAEILGVSFSTYRKIETGIRNPSYNFLKKLKNTFPDIDVNKIFFEN